MIIKVDSIDDFLVHLDPSSASVHLNTVYCSKLEKSMTEHHVKESHKVMLGIQVSAIVTYPDMTQALIEYGEFLDYDLKTSDGHSHGSDLFVEIRDQLFDWCESNSLKVLPGIVSID